MASRMEKYYNKRSRTSSRTQKNRLLYQEEIEQEKIEHKQISRTLPSSLNIEDEEDIARLEKVLKIYEEKKQNQQQQRLFVKLSEEESETVKNLVDAITHTSNLNNLNKELKKFTNDKRDSLINELKNYEDDEPRIPLRKIKKPKKHSSEFDELNDFLLSYDDETPQEVRKSNKILKAIVGLLFIIVTMAIVYLIYIDIK